MVNNNGNKFLQFIRAHGAGFPGGILRFAIFVPGSIYQTMASNHWKVIRTHDYLQSSIFNPSIAKGEHLAATWGRFAYFWNFAAWFPQIVIPPPFTMLFNIVDAAVAVMLSIATHLQTGYSPHDKDRCQGSPGAHDWQRPPGANESFFDAAARLNATKTDSISMCKSFVQEWQYGITLSFFFSLIAFVNIILCIVTCLFQYRDAHSSNRSYSKEVFSAMNALFKCFIDIILVWFWRFPLIIVVLIFRCLPIGVKSRTRFARQYTSKTGQHVENSIEIKLKKLKRKDKVVRYQNRQDGTPTTLADFLSIYDILILITEDLHYSDIAHLSQTCKSVREAVLPAGDFAQRRAHFRLYTCSPISKTQCWVCENQICDGCHSQRYLKQLPPLWHLDNCQSYCSNCYFHKIQNKVPRQRMVPAHCTCKPVTTNPNMFQRWWKGEAYFSNQKLATKLRAVCADCDLMDDVALLAKRKRRTKLDLKNPHREGADRCRSCQELLGKGPRWWICGKCSKECRDTCHAPWGKSKDTPKSTTKGKGKSGAVIGEEAV